MTKFDTINGTLCIMTEPVPLTTDAKSPCVVRLIQDDSPMGRFNSGKMAYIDDIYICTGIDVHGDCAISNDVSLHHPTCLEIIGYPVADGSKEWALYQMIQGGKVVGNHDPIKKQHPISCKDGKVGWCEICGEFVYDSDDHFIRRAKDGWQIYTELKPEPCPTCNGTGKVEKPAPAFKVGDWVEVSGCGRTIHGKCISTEGTVSEPNNMIRACGYLFNPDGTDATYRCKTHGYLITRKLSPFEVEVDFGFAKGRILSRMSGYVKVLNNKSVVIATIIVSEITNPTTRSLVESLLKAQEE